jgi:hypothetical protein
VEEQAIRQRFVRAFDLRAESEERLDTRERAHAHAEIHDNQIREAAEINSQTLRRHAAPLRSRMPSWTILCNRKNALARVFPPIQFQIVRSSQ